MLGVLKISSNARDDRALWQSSYSKCGDRTFRPGYSPLTELHSSVIVALQEFHRTQCFFALAFGIASIISLNADHLQPQTFGQLMDNFSFIAAVAENTSFCIVFGYCYLRQNSERSLYILILTWGSFSVARATFAVAMSRFSSITLTEISEISPSETYADCWDSNPTVPCFDGLTFYGSYLQQTSQPSYLGFIALSFSFVEDYGGDALNWIYRQVDRFYSIRAVVERLERVIAPFPMLQSLLKLYAVGKIVMFVYLVRYAGSNVLILAFFANNSKLDLSNWGFGQIVAVSVWAQPIGEFLQSYLRK